MRGSLPPLCRELPPYGRLAGTPERPALLLPVRRRRPLQPFQHQRLVRLPRDDRLDNVGRQQREAQNPTDLALRDVFRVSDLAHGRIDAFIKHPLPAPRPGERLDQRAIWLRLGAGHNGTPVGSDDTLTAASTLNLIGMRTIERWLPSSRASTPLHLPLSSRRNCRVLQTRLDSPSALIRISSAVLAHVAHPRADCLPDAGATMRLRPRRRSGSGSIGRRQYRAEPRQAVVTRIADTQSISQAFLKSHCQGASFFAATDAAFGQVVARVARMLPAGPRDVLPSATAALSLVWAP